MAVLARGIRAHGVHPSPRINSSKLLMCFGAASYPLAVAINATTEK